MCTRDATWLSDAAVAVWRAVCHSLELGVQSVELKCTCTSYLMAAGAHTRDANMHYSVSLNSGCSSLPDVLRVKRDTVLVAKSVNVEQIRIDVYTKHTCSRLSQPTPKRPRGRTDPS